MVTRKDIANKVELFSHDEAMVEHARAPQLFCAEPEFAPDEFPTVGKDVSLQVLALAKLIDLQSLLFPTWGVEQALEIDRLGEAVDHALLDHERALFVDVRLYFQVDMIVANRNVAKDTEFVVAVGSEFEIGTQRGHSTVGVEREYDLKRSASLLLGRQFKTDFRGPDLPTLGSVQLQMTSHPLLKGVGDLEMVLM